MEFQILSRTRAKAASYAGLEKSSIVISITDVDGAAVAFAADTNIKAILRLRFADTDCDDPEAMQPCDAEKIVAFVRLWRDSVKQIAVHCEAGISRSAGVAAALMLWLNGSDAAVFDCPVYKPNMRCYRLVIDRLVQLGEL